MRPLVLLLLLCSSSLALDIPQEDRIPNRGPKGYCSIACLETLGNVQDIDSLDGLMDSTHADYADGYPGYPDLLASRLKALKVKFEETNFGGRDDSLLRKHAEDKGVMVGLLPGNSHSIGPHAIIVLSYGEKVRFWDPNHPADTWSVNKRWFLRWWSGWSVVILKE